MTEELKVIQKTFDLMVYLTPLINKFSRDYKFTLGDRIQSHGLDTIEDLIEARYTKERRSVLQKVNIRLEKIRTMLRLSREFGLLASRSYEHVSERLEEIGRMVGGWLRVS